MQYIRLWAKQAEGAQSEVIFWLIENISLGSLPGVRDIFFTVQCIDMNIQTVHARHTNIHTVQRFLYSVSMPTWTN